MGQGGLKITKDGRNEWIGWIELKTEEVNEIAMMNTGWVNRDVIADVLAVVEAENRIALQRFSDNILEAVNKDKKITKAKLYEDIMVIDGNDERGIDVGLMTKNGHRVGYIQSHINDKDDKGQKMFSRDCPEYQIFTPKGKEIWILPNHFKSKFGSDDPKSKARRKSQSEKVAQLYIDLIKLGYENVVVLGNLNDTPDSDPIKPLLATSLKDVSIHPSFDTGQYKEIGTYGLVPPAIKLIIYYYHKLYFLKSKFQHYLEKELFQAHDLRNGKYMKCSLIRFMLHPNTT